MNNVLGADLKKKKIKGENAQTLKHGRGNVNPNSTFMCCFSDKIFYNESVTC